MEEVKKTGLTLQQAKMFADAAIADVKNGFISTGYYLKVIRDEKLWKEHAYVSFDAFLNVNYEKDKSWASRCVSLYEKFGTEVSPGELPQLDPEYKDYNVSQLIEMISLPEEKRELVTPETPVRSIREMKPKREKKVATVATSETKENVPDPEEVVEVEKSCDVTTSEAEEKEQDPEPEIDHFFDRNESIDDAYGWVRAQVVKEYLEGGYKSPGKECKVETCGEEYWVIKGAEVTTFYDERKGYPIKGVTFDVENTRLEREYNFFFGKQEVESTQEQQPESKRESSKFNSTPTSCSHREEYNCTVLEENRSVPGDGSNCGSSCCWTCRYQGRCELECNASAGRDGEIPKYDAAWAVKTWAEIPACRGDLKKILKACRENFTNATRAKAVQNTISPYGAYSRGCGEYSFSFHSFDGGIDFRIGKVDIHLKYGRFVQELATLYPDFEIPEAVPEKPELAPPKQEPVPEEPGTVPDPPETVIDGEFVEIPPEPEMSVQSIFEKEKAELHEYIKVFQDEGLEMPPIVERQKIIVAALEALMEAQEQPESEPEPIKQEQPELPILKNNDQRAAFVDAYETWPLWIETKETGERYYRYDLPDGTSMVVKVYHAMLFDYKATGKKYEDRYSEGYGKHEYYFLQGGKFFRDCETNRSDLIEKLKELQKKGKGDKS